VTRPNFIIIIPDQLRADALGCFGNPLIQTPNIDELAAAGTVFTEAYVQHPVCSPSRASFLTGWYPHVRGHRTLTHLLRADEPNLLRILKDSGYHVTWAGARGDTFAAGVTELSVHEYGFDEPPTRSRNREFPSDTWARAFYRGRVGDRSVDDDEAAVRTAERWLAHPPDQPWVLFVPLIAPHCPFEVEDPWFSMYDRTSVPPPVSAGDGRQAAFKQAIRDTYGLDRMTPEMWQELRAVYYGMVSRLDSHVGRIMSSARQARSADRTVTFFFSDHGEYLGDLGLIEKWPSAMDRCITRDPLIISGGGLPGGQRCDTMAELIDVVPTVLALARLQAPHHHFGRSLLPVLDDPRHSHREYAFTEGGFSTREEPRMERGPFPYDLKGQIQHREPACAGRAVAVRDRRWTYIWRLYEPAELYDRHADQHETTNLAGQPGLTDVEERLRCQLLRWQVETADVLPPDDDPRSPAVALPAPGARPRPAGGAAGQNDDNPASGGTDLR